MKRWLQDWCLFVDVNKVDAVVKSDGTSWSDVDAVVQSTSSSLQRNVSTRLTCNPFDLV